MLQTFNKLTNKSILYIEDDIELQEQIATIFKKFFNKVYLADNGYDAYDIYQKHHLSIDIIITDIHMPDMNGIDVLKTIKSDKNLPVIMLSGKDSPQLIETAKELGVDDFLPKPFRDEELVEKVKTLVEV